MKLIAKVREPNSGHIQRGYVAFRYKDSWHAQRDYVAFMYKDWWHVNRLMACTKRLRRFKYKETTTSLTLVSWTAVLTRPEVLGLTKAAAPQIAEAKTIDFMVEFAVLWCNSKWQSCVKLFSSFCAKKRYLQKYDNQIRIPLQWEVAGISRYLAVADISPFCHSRRDSVRIFESLFPKPPCVEESTGSTEKQRNKRSS